jgi:nicotinamidase-related amidase
MRAGLTALLVLDLQKDFLQPTGRLPIYSQQVGPLLEATNHRIQTAAEEQTPIVYIVNQFDPFDLNNLFRNFSALRGSPGSALDPRVIVPPGAPIVPKRAPDAFTNPRLTTLLASWSARRLLITGVFADACVAATATSALRKGFEVAVAADSVGAASDQARDRALSRLRSKGAYIPIQGGV